MANRKIDGKTTRRLAVVLLLVLAVWVSVGESAKPRKKGNGTKTAAGNKLSKATAAPDGAIIEIITGLGDAGPGYAKSKPPPVVGAANSDGDQPAAAVAARPPAPTTRLRIPRLKPLRRDLLDDYDSFDDYDNNLNQFGFAASRRKSMGRLGGLTNGIDDYEDLLFEDYDNGDADESLAAKLSPGSRYLSSEV